MGKNKELHPADQQRKLERKKEKQRNAKQRKETRTNILKQKRPEQIIENLKKLELLEAQGSITGNQAIKEHKHKRKQLLDAYEKCIEMWEEEYKRNPRLLQEGQGPQLGQLPKTRADLEKYLKQQVERLMAMTKSEAAGSTVPGQTVAQTINLHDHPMLPVLFPFGIPALLPLPPGNPPEDDVDADGEAEHDRESDSEEDSDQDDNGDNVESKPKKARPENLASSKAHPAPLGPVHPNFAVPPGVGHFAPGFGGVGGMMPMFHHLQGMPPLPPGPPPPGLEAAAVSDSDSGSEGETDADKGNRLAAEVNPALCALVPASVRVQRASAPKPSRPITALPSRPATQAASSSLSSAPPTSLAAAGPSNVSGTAGAEDSVQTAPPVEKPSRAVISAAPATRRVQAPVSLLAQLTKKSAPAAQTPAPDLDKEYQDFLSDLSQM